MPAQDASEPAARITATLADAESQAHADRRLLIGGRLVAAVNPSESLKQSGVGREMGVAGMEEFLKRKTFAAPVAGRPA